MSRHDYTFSSLITRLLQIEHGISELYSSQCLPESAFSSYLQEYKDMSTRLERARTESVTEFTLEPIPSSGIDEIILNIESVVHDDSLSITQKLIRSEKLNAELLKHASALVAAISAEANQLLRGAYRKAERRSELLAR